MATNRLADILKEEYKTKGIFSGTVSGVGKKSLEKLDIRNALFGGSGIGSVMGRKVFGRGYSGIKRGEKSPSVSSVADLAGPSAGILEEINQSSKISAKNSLALPSMARDMFLVKQNIIKMVKLQGGTPTTKSGNWFSRQSARESAFESQYANKGKSPTKEQKTEKSSGFWGFLENLLSGNLIGKVVGGLIKGGLIVGALAALGEGIKKFFSDAEFRQKVWDGISNFFKSEFGKSVGLGLIAVAAAFATFKVAVNLITAAIEAAAMRIGRAVGVPGGPGGKPGRKGRRTRSGRGGLLAFGTILGLQAADSLVDGGGNDGGPGDNTSPSSGGKTNWASVGVDSAIAGVAGVDAASRIRDISSRKGVSNYNSKAGRFVDSSGKFVKTSQLPKGDMLKKFFDFAAKAASKGWMSRLGGKLAVRLGTSIATKVVVFLGGLAVPGAGWLASAASMALLAYDIYAIYDAIFGPGGIYEELEKEDNSGGSTPKSPTPSGSNPYSIIPSAQAATNDKSPITGAATGGASGGGAGIPSSGGAIPQGKTWSQLSKEEQDKLLMNQAIAEGWNKKTSIQHSHNNPGNIVAKNKNEVFPAQAKFGGVPGGTYNGLTFVKFPTMEAGWAAMRDLWSRKFANIPLDKALADWSHAGANQSNYNAVAMGGKGGSAPTQIASSESAMDDAVTGKVIDNASRTVADAKQASTGGGNSNYNDNKQTIHNYSSTTMGGYERAMPQSRDFYMGVVRQKAV